MSPRRSIADRLFTWSDLILILSILFIAIVSPFFIGVYSQMGGEVVIEYEGGRIIKPLNNWAERLELKGPLGVSLAEVERGRVRMISSPCPGKVCTHSGWISKRGQSIVCVPNRIIIRINGRAKEKYDALSR